MSDISTFEAQRNLHHLIEETAASHQPIIISGKRNKAVLIAEEDWTAIQETIFLLSKPGMHESIREGMNTTVSECGTKLDFD